MQREVHGLVFSLARGSVRGDKPPGHIVAVVRMDSAHTRRGTRGKRLPGTRITAGLRLRDERAMGGGGLRRVEPGPAPRGAPPPWSASRIAEEYAWVKNFSDTCESEQQHAVILVRKKGALSQLDKHNMW